MYQRSGWYAWRASRSAASAGGVYYDAVARLKKQRRRLEASGGPRDRIDQIDKRIIDTMKRLNDQVRKNDG